MLLEKARDKLQAGFVQSLFCTLRTANMVQSCVYDNWWLVVAMGIVEGVLSGTTHDSHSCVVSKKLLTVLLPARVVSKKLLTVLLPARH